MNIGNFVFDKEVGRIAKKRLHVGYVVPRMPIQTLLEPLLVKEMRCHTNCSAQNEQPV
jgi:hypothetical protein